MPVSSGDYTWKSAYENGIWTYGLDEVWVGLKTALSGVENRGSVAAMGISAMMHGYLAFGKDWNLLVPYAVVLEELAFMAFHTEAIAPGKETMQQELLDKHYLRKHGKNAYYGQG